MDPIIIIINLIIYYYYKIIINDNASGYKYKKKVVTKEVLVGLKKSPFWKYYTNGSDEQLLLKFGFCRKELNELFVIIKPYYDNYTFSNGKNKDGLRLKLRKRKPSRKKIPIQVCTGSRFTR